MGTTPNRIISNLMEVVRAKDAVKQSIDFGSTVRQVFERIQNCDEIESRIDCRPEPFTVAADPVQLRQVLGNLLTNGAEAMGGKPPGPHVSIPRNLPAQLRLLESHYAST